MSSELLKLLQALREKTSTDEQAKKIEHLIKQSKEINSVNEKIKRQYKELLEILSGEDNVRR